MEIFIFSYLIIFRVEQMENNKKIVIAVIAVIVIGVGIFAGFKLLNKDTVNKELPVVREDITKDNVEVDKGNFVYSEINEICLVTDDIDISLYRAKPTNHYFNYKTQSFKKDISAEEKGDYITIQSNLVEFIKILGYYEGQNFYIMNTSKLSYTTDTYKSMAYKKVFMFFCLLF